MLREELQKELPTVHMFCSKAEILFEEIQSTKNLLKTFNFKDYHWKLSYNQKLLEFLQTSLQDNTFNKPLFLSKEKYKLKESINEKTKCESDINTYFKEFRYLLLRTYSFINDVISHIEEEEFVKLIFSFLEYEKRGKDYLYSIFFNEDIEIVERVFQNNDFTLYLINKTKYVLIEENI